MSYVESYTDPNKFFNKLAKWMEKTVDIEFGIFGNLENVFFDIHVRSEPVMPNTYQVMPWEPDITVEWAGDIGRAVIKIGWLNRATMINDYEIVQTIGEHFNFEMLWPRGVPQVPQYMFDVETYYMGETEAYIESFSDPSIHNLDIVLRPFIRGRMLNAEACAQWLELS